MSFFSQSLISRKIHAISAACRNARAKGNSMPIMFGNKIDLMPRKTNCRKGEKVDASIFNSIKIAICPLLFAVTFFAQNANALCINNPGLRAVDFSMNVGNIVVPVDARIGQVLEVFRREIVPPPGINAQCGGGGGRSHYVLRLGVPVPGQDKIYTTNIPGIGYRLRYDFGGNTAPERERPLPFETTHPHGGLFLGNPQIFVLEFIVISEVSQGGILFSGTVMEMTDDLGGVTMRAFFSANATKVILPSCRVAGPPNKPIDVLFGRVPQSNFKGRGSVAAERNFEITLNCRAGVGERNIVHLRMDATKDPAAVGDDGVLQITQGGANTATGVGIQIVDRNSRTPVRFGDDALVGPSKDGDYVLPYTARYFQTGNRVTPGQANGTATFTVIYK